METHNTEPLGDFAKIRSRCHKYLLAVATHLSPIEKYVVAPGSYKNLGLIAINCGVQTGSGPFYLRQQLIAHTALSDASIELFYSSKFPFTLICGDTSFGDGLKPLKTRLIEVATTNGGPTAYVYAIPVPHEMLWKGGLLPSSGMSLLYLLCCKGDAVLHTLRRVFQPPTIGVGRVCDDPLQPSITGLLSMEEVGSGTSFTSDTAHTSYFYKGAKVRCVECVAVSEIPGLYIVSDFITHSEHNAIWNELNGDAASHFEVEHLARRDVAHFNRRFYYGINRVGAEGVQVNSRPAFYDWMAQRLCNTDSEVKIHNYPMKEHPEYFDQLTVNYYNYDDPKSKLVPGIARHVDSHDAFGDYIAIVSLGSHTVIEFSRYNRPPDVFAPLGVLVKPCSLLLLTGEARYCWTHCIVEKREDVLNDQLPPLQRGNRLSLTWRCGRDTPHARESCLCPSLCDGT